MKPIFIAAAVFSSAMNLYAHRLDEYLQAMIVSVEKSQLAAQMILTPGVAVFPEVLAGIDTDRDGILSEAEQHAYAARVLGDLSISIDGQPLKPRLLSAKFPPIDHMREGRGEIQLDFIADLRPGGADRKLVIVNHHAGRISAYQVNCLVPHDPEIRIVAQKRNYTQSRYELDFEQPATGRRDLFSWWPSARGPLGAGSLILFAWMAVLHVPILRRYRKFFAGEPVRRKEWKRAGLAP